MPQVYEGGWEEGINLQYPALPSRALTTFVSLVAAEGSPAPGWKLGVLHDVHPGPGRKRTSCLLSQIHIGSQVFFIRSEALRPSSVQVCRALALVGSFPPMPGFG